MKWVCLFVAVGMCAWCGAGIAQGQAYTYGIDVSHWQGNINWTSVAASGKEFAFIKASEGVGYVDPTCNTNVSGARAAGMLAGVYHFATPYTNSVNDAVAEADWFVSTAGSYITSGYLRPVLDLESGSSLGKTTLSNWIITWMNRVESLTGVEPIIYANTNYSANYFTSSLSGYDVWIANWSTSLSSGNPGTGVFGSWSFWQYSSTTSVPGISGNVDGDVTYNLAAYVIPEPGMIWLVLAAGGAGLWRRGSINRNGKR